MAFGVLALAAIVLELGAATIYVTSGGMRRAQREENLTMVIQGAEAGIDFESDAIWQGFKISQNLSTVDTATSAATEQNPCIVNNGTLDGPDPNSTAKIRYTAAVIGYKNTDSYTRDLTIRSVAWLDRNNNSTWDNGEPRKSIRCAVRYTLSRAGVFDYAYFVNNYGWMNGFSSTQLIVNGDMRANGNFDFSGGTPTINGSVYAAANNKLIPPATGTVNITPNQWSNSYYATNAVAQARQAYDAAKHGAKGSQTYENWRDLIYDKDASIVGDRPSGAVVADNRGTRTYSGTVLDPQPTSVMPMPDLSDINKYVTLSTNYVDTKATYNDGTANPYYNQGAYVQVWNATASRYDTVTTNGVFSGSRALIGDATHPIKVHGPVTFTQDVVIKGVVQGQGTLYTGRNVHIVGDITYKDPPDFRGTDPTTIDNANEKKSILGLAARASIIMGDTSTFSWSTPLQYMAPPFTHARYDDYGNLIPAFDARQVDSTGMKKYQSTLGDAYVHSISSTISNINAVLYTNFLGGGNIGGGGGGVTFNGSIISRDEAMVLFSLPFKMNYDNRIKERSLQNKPLIDIDLPRTPSVVKLTWHEEVL